MANGKSLQRIDAANRRQKVVELRAKGMTWMECAAEAGYSSANNALRAFNEAMAAQPLRNSESWRAEQVAQLQEQYAQLGQIIANPPPVHSAIGKTITDPETGELIRDHALVVRAIEAQRKVGESLRKLLGVDAPPARSLDSYQLEMLAEVARLKARLPVHMISSQEPTEDPTDERHVVMPQEATVDTTGETT